MHELSVGTWLIHIATVIEWILAIIIIARIGSKTENKSYIWLAIAMLPNLASAMAAITWHIFDNDPSLKGLVVLQAGLTFVGNCSLAIAALYMLRSQEKTL